MVRKAHRYLGSWVQEVGLHPMMFRNLNLPIWAWVCFGWHFFLLELSCTNPRWARLLPGEEKERLSKGWISNKKCRKYLAEDDSVFAMENYFSRGSDSERESSHGRNCCDVSSWLVIWRALHFGFRFRACASLLRRWFREDSESWIRQPTLLPAGHDWLEFFPFTPNLASFVGHWGYVGPACSNEEGGHIWNDAVKLVFKNRRKSHCKEVEYLVFNMYFCNVYVHNIRCNSISQNCESEM